MGGDPGLIRGESDLICLSQKRRFWRFFWVCVCVGASTVLRVKKVDFGHPLHFALKSFKKKDQSADLGNGRPGQAAAGRLMPNSVYDQLRPNSVYGQIKAFIWP